MFRTPLLIALLAQGCPSPAQDSAAVTVAARNMMARVGNCALITVDESGFPRSRTMDPFPPERDFTVWLATNPRSRKVEELRKNPRVTLYYADGDNGYVSLHGMARIVDDGREKERRWKEEWKAYYPDRKDSYLLIEVTPVRLEIIDYKSGISGNPQTWEPSAITFPVRR